MKTNSIIEQLYLAQRDYFNILNPSNELKDKLTEIIKLELELRAKLSNELFNIFENLDQLYNEYNADIARYLYKLGFKAGFKLAVEANNK